MSSKEVFLDRLRSRFYNYLKSGSMKEWDPSQVYNLASAVVSDNKVKIDVYLIQKKVTLTNINEAIDEIIEKILIPSIEIK